MSKDIQNTTVVVTKLPPGYPEGSVEGMAPWTVNSNGLNRYRGEGRVHKRMLTPRGNNYPGCDAHIDLLDKGGSLVDPNN